MANEKRLIDRNEIFPNGTFFASAEDPIKSLDELIKRIWSIPTVDAVELPPIKIGDTAYFIIGGKIFRAEVYFIRWEQHKLYGTHSEIYATVVPNYSVGASFNDFGKTVFLSKEEAEAALAKMNGGNGE